VTANVRANTSCPKRNNPTLATLRDAAAKAGIWLHVGSLPVCAEGDGEGRFANRTFVIDPTGAIAARYDKIHMFDVDLATGESWRESAAYRPVSTSSRRLSGRSAGAGDLL